MKSIILAILLVGALSVDYQVSTVPSSTRKTVYKNYAKFLNNTLKDNLHNFVIPGLGQDFVPQGVAGTKEFIIFTAYYEKYGSSTKKNSMLYLVSRSTGKVAKAVKLDTTGHVGGVAATDKNVYVCLDKKLGEISLSTIVNAKDESVIGFKTKHSLPSTCSFASYYKDRIYTGTFNNSTKQTAYGFTISGGKLTLKAKYIIPKKIQGFSVISDTQIVVSQSYGRNSDSSIIVYTVASAYKGGDLTTAKKKEHTLPPMTEGIFTGEDGNLYIIFESGANSYYAAPKNKKDNYAKNPMDRIVAINKSKL